MSLAERPCCAAAAARMIKQINVNGCSIGLSHLDEVMNEIKAMGLQNDAEIGEILLKRIKIFNYIPPSASSEYKSALLEEYRKH